MLDSRVYISIDKFLSKGSKGEKERLLIVGDLSTDINT